ncbi:MAG TPA: glycine--tRNA ligase subunit alpha [Vicinamibacteria bacterium]|nr:glycine--tRNA ligase subunit alpha [Vicinamibacteria bacterium]
MIFQELVFKLTKFWSDRGVLVHQPYDLEMGAGTMHPETFFRVLGPRPWKVVYVQPSRRPTDGRYGDNPNRLYKHHQLQLILKPSPHDIQDQYLRSLRACGIEPREHDIRFEEDDWESPTIGAWGIGWQVLLDGLEITQFTYFQQAGGIELSPISVEITYGLERLDMYLQNVDDVYELEWAKGIKYGEVRRRDEVEGSRFSFDLANVEMTRRHFEDLRQESERLLAAGTVLPAYELCLRCSHLFNILDARGAVSVSERTALILKIRELACAIARAYVESLTPVPV